MSFPATGSNSVSNVSEANGDNLKERSAQRRVSSSACTRRINSLLRAVALNDFGVVKVVNTPGSNSDSNVILSLTSNPPE